MSWLTDEVDADLKKFDQIPRRYDFSGYDLVVVSSGTYMGMMPLNRFLKRHWKRLQDKKVVVVAVGAAAPDDPWSIRSYNHIPEKIRNKIAYFKIAGEMPDKNRPTNYVSPIKKENLKEIIAKIQDLSA